MSKIILDLCGGSGSWSTFYAQSPEYDVRIIDPIQGTGDARLLEKLSEPVYGILAAPVCTMFAASGARWKRTEQQMLEALSLVDACIRIVVVHKPVFWVLENPVGKLQRWLGKPRMYFNLCDYGDPYTKKTCLWGDFNEPVKTPVEPILGSMMHKLYGGKSQKTKYMRSLTPQGFAKAFFESNR